MDMSLLVMWVGFIFASYSVVGNDVIQTRVTFLTSNEKRVKWYILCSFASSIMVYALVAGYMNNVAQGNLVKLIMINAGTLHQRTALGLRLCDAIGETLNFSGIQLLAIRTLSRAGGLCRA